MKIFDAFPFFNELDVLEVRLAELYPVVDQFLIVECCETYGGKRKPLYFADNRSRFTPWADKIVYKVIDALEPEMKYTLQRDLEGVSAADIRTTGRAREAFARDAMLPLLLKLNPAPHDLLSFGDCDEIPRASAIQENRERIAQQGITRLKQRTYYYNVNTQIDYGRDVCSRARLGRISDVKAVGGLFNFRMAGNRDPEFPVIEEGGWHFSYFGGDLGKLHEKVAALNPFLLEYKLFGNDVLVQDVLQRKDLHHRHVNFSELPETFEQRSTDDPLLPAHFLLNRDKFRHFTASYFQEKYASHNQPNS